MAAGDVRSGLVNVASSDFLDIRPPMNEEWIVINIIIPNGKNAELYYSDGVNSVLVDSRNFSWLGYSFHITNTFYLRVKNLDTSTQYIGYTGVQIK